MAITPDMQFELGEDPYVSRTNRDTVVTYTKDSVLRYRAESIQDVIANPEQLMAMIKHHLKYQVPRLKYLESYYLGNNQAILSGKRRIEENKSDHRVRHSFAEVISNFINSYTLSNPVKITSNNEEDQAFIEALKQFGQENDIDAHNLEIGKDQNNMGRAYEMLQRTEQDQDKIYRLDPTTVFMIYDQSVRTRVIGACRYYPVNNYSRKPHQQIKYRVELYTHNETYYFKPTSITENTSANKLIIDEDGIQPHGFNGVPIIEYRSDRYKMGVYEKQIPLFDAYDAGQSDTANYMTDFNDAILVLEGKIKNADNPDYIRKMKDANIILLLPEQDDFGESKGNIKASYLTKSYDVQGVEAYKTRLKDDIYTLAAIPNLSDEAFSGNQSGEALKYKLFGLQQKKSDKEKFFAKGLRVRYRLLENLKANVNETPKGNPAELEFTFTPNLPQAYLEQLKTYRDAGGEISQKTMLKLLSFIDDAEEELEQIQEEKQRTTSLFEDDYGFDNHTHDEEGLHSLNSSGIAPISTSN